MLLQYIHFFFFNDTATTEIYTLSLHDALPILIASAWRHGPAVEQHTPPYSSWVRSHQRSEEHTSELQSRGHLVCRLLLEKKNVLYDQRYAMFVRHSREALAICNVAGWITNRFA